MIRIVGLSATLPNYKDVGEFIHAKPEDIFYFDMSYRAVPMSTKFITLPESEEGVKSAQFNYHANDVAFKETEIVVEQGKQVIIFVHTRKETVVTAQKLIKKLRNDNKLEAFKGKQGKDFNSKIKKLQGKELREFILKIRILIKVHSYNLVNGGY